MLFSLSDSAAIFYLKILEINRIMVSDNILCLKLKNGSWPSVDIEVIFAIMILITNHYRNTILGIGNVNDWLLWSHISSGIQ